MSKNFIAGKRQRYTNPFRFYLTVSILFFLILGLSNSLERFKQLNKGDVKKESSLIAIDGVNTNKKDIDIDSLKYAVNQSLKDSWIPIDSVNRKKIVEQAAKEASDTTKTTSKNKISFGGFKIDEFIAYQKKHPKVNTDEALDSLKQEKTFFNRFLYSRAELANSFVDRKEAREQFFSELLSYGSIALFVFLPIFTLFLKLFYIRRKYTYVDHLIFVFHTQTVFFMLLTIYYLIEIFGIDPQLWIFIILFLLYLFIAMRKFYNQGIFKTFVKFTFLNMAYFFISSIGVSIVLLISFALY